MASVTPRRSTRIPHNHTPKMTERKKSLFQGDVEATKDTLTQHRQLPVVDSESDTDDCDLGIMGALDSSSGEETQDHAAPKTPERGPFHETRSHTKRLLKETHDLKNFIKSPFTLMKYQTKYSHTDGIHSLSTPTTPHFHNHPGTPSSTHSCASAHTTSSTSSRARKSLASLIADTESCSSSLKDLNFDTDSGTDSKENSPSKVPRRSGRKLKITPKLATFKGILMEQKKNSLASPIKSPLVRLTKMDIASFISPTQMLKTPESITENNTSPKVHNRRPVLEIAESPEDSCDNDKGYKRLRNDSVTSETEPNSKYPKLDTVGSAPKARLSLFNSDKLKEILSAKSFYGKRNPDLNTSFTTKLANAIVKTTYQQKRHYYSTSQKRKVRKSGQINMGVKHRIRKPKILKNKIVLNRSGASKSEGEGINNSTMSNVSLNNTSLMSHNTSQELDNDKADPFDSEKQTIDALLSQWTEEEVPENELTYVSKPALQCFNSSVIEETRQIFQPMTAVPVVGSDDMMPNSEVIVELGAKAPEVAAVNQDVMMAESGSHEADHGGALKGFLPVEGGYILVDEPNESVQEDLPDLDEIERELKMLDEQILKMAQSNNIDANAVLASTETIVNSSDADAQTKDKSKLFPIFSKPNPGPATARKPPSSSDLARKPLLRNASRQYVIDAGQKRFGATQCKECGVIYEIGDPQDEHSHLVHHNAIDVLRFNGWKEEQVVGTWEGGRCVRVRGAGVAGVGAGVGAAGWRRVRSVLDRVVHPQLGYGGELPRHCHAYTAYLYIEKRQIIGCLVVEPKAKAYKLLPGDPDCCSVEHYPVKCGVTRIWTHINHLRRGIASRMLDCARATFLYGEGVRLEEIAFSAPTAAGKALATTYCGTPNFFVYLD